MADIPLTVGATIGKRVDWDNRDSAIEHGVCESWSPDAYPCCLSLESHGPYHVAWSLYGRIRAVWLVWEGSN